MSCAECPVTQCGETHEEDSAQVVDCEAAEEEVLWFESADPPHECESGDCVVGEDVAVPEEVGVHESKEEEPGASGEPEGGAFGEFGVVFALFVCAIELAGVHDDS